MRKIVSLWGIVLGFSLLVVGCRTPLPSTSLPSPGLTPSPELAAINLAVGDVTVEYATIVEPVGESQSSAKTVQVAIDLEVRDKFSAVSTKVEIEFEGTQAEQFSLEIEPMGIDEFLDCVKQDASECWKGTCPDITGKSGECEKRVLGWPFPDFCFCYYKSVWTHQFSEVPNDTFTVTIDPEGSLEEFNEDDNTYTHSP